MRGMSKGIMQSILGGIAFLLVLACVGAGTLYANEPSLLVYPNQPTIFRYDPSRYELVTPADPSFDSFFAISGVMLWDKLLERIPHEVYRAPELVGFEPSPVGRNEFVVRRSEFKVIVDGFAQAPREYNNLYMRFIPEPSHSNLSLKLEGEFLTELITSIPSLSVTTPTGDGFYSDTRPYHLRWSGAAALRITVYSDKNNDGVYNGGFANEFSILVVDGVVSTGRNVVGRTQGPLPRITTFPRVRPESLHR